MFSLFKPKMEKEVFEAYFDRLPDHVQVNWFRDGDYIIGKIKAGEHEFTTQGKNGNDFVKMVNDAVFTVFDIPEKHIKIMDRFYSFKPGPEEMRQLQLNQIRKARINFLKPELALA